MKIKLIVLSLFCFKAFSQQKTLPALIEIGLKNNKNIGLALKNVELQSSLINTAYEMPKTAFELQYGNIQSPNVGDYTAMAVQYFELPKVYALKRKYNESLVTIGESALDLQRHDLRFQISNIYYELMYLNKMQELFEVEISKLLELEKIAKSKLKEGEVDKSDALSVGLKIQEIQIKSKKMQAEQERQKSLLKILLGSEVLPEITYQDATFKSVLNYDISQNKWMLLQQNYVNTAQIETANYKNKLLPSLKAGVVNQSMMGFKNQFVGIGGIEIAIFKKAQKSRVEAAKINEVMKQMERDKTAIQIQTELNAAFERATILYESQQIYQTKLLPQSQELMQIITKKYQAGSIDYFEWNLPYTQFLSNKMEVLNVEKELNLNQTIINYLSGNE